MLTVGFAVSDGLFFVVMIAMWMGLIIAMVLMPRVITVDIAATGYNRFGAVIVQAIP